MKRNIFIKGAAVVAVALGMASCSGDYLDLEPVTSIDTSTVTSTTDGARYGMRGVCRTMWWGESANGVSQRFFQGEASAMIFYGDVSAIDAFYYVWSGYKSEFFGWDYMRRTNYWFASLGWKYYYNIVASTNKILDKIDEAEGSEGDRQMIKAQLLTLRAHAYTKLLQIYGPRWEDSRNGACHVMPLRLKGDVDDIPLSTWNECYTQICSDLDTAIGLYQACGQKRTFDWEPDITVAYATYARAAMTRNDWEKARDMSRNARQGYPIMDATAYKGGFAEPTSEWMWYNAPDEEAIGYWSIMAMYGCNGAYTTFWGMGGGAINYDLYRMAHNGDIRKELFFTPDKINYNMPPAKGKLKVESWWNDGVTDPVNMSVNKNSTMKTILSAFGQTKVPGNDEAKWGLPYVPDSQGEFSADNPFVIPFGAQYKFWGLGTYSVTSFPFMRASEFALYEAEACYRLNDVTGAQNALKAVNEKRFDSYDATAYTGEALLEEIKLTSRMELWGEGHSWFNLKRWNVPAERRAWEAKNVDSNNIPVDFAAEFPVDLNRGWSYVVPETETRYNRAINLAEIND